jgi:hypothetical protein
MFYDMMKRLYNAARCGIVALVLSLPTPVKAEYSTSTAPSPRVVMADLLDPLNPISPINNRPTTGPSDNQYTDMSYKKAIAIVCGLSLALGGVILYQRRKDRQQR